MLLKLCGPPLTCSMNDANVLASLKVPLLLIVAPFQNWIALLLAPVLPDQVVVFSRLTVPPPTITLVLAPEIVRSLAKVVMAVPENVPPVHVAGPWKVRLVPVIVLPLNRKGEVRVPPFSVTTASAPTFSVLTTKVPAPWIVALSSVWLPFLNSS